jgi:hypothetical protein
MNQAILFNDDHHYDTTKQQWVFTGSLSGEKVLVVINSRLHQHSIITDAIKFDWEILVEDWLEHNEPISGVINIKS